jgi:hypothetical protein
VRFSYDLETRLCCSERDRKSSSTASGLLLSPNCVVWFSVVTAVRIGVLPFWGGYTNWGSDKDEESKTILHPSSSSDDYHNGLPRSCSSNTVGKQVMFGIQPY